MHVNRVHVLRVMVELSRHDGDGGAGLMSCLMKGMEYWNEGCERFCWNVGGEVWEGHMNMRWN